MVDEEDGYEYGLSVENAEKYYGREPNLKKALDRAAFIDILIFPMMTGRIVRDADGMFQMFSVAAGMKQIGIYERNSTKANRRTMWKRKDFVPLQIGFRSLAADCVKILPI